MGAGDPAMMDAREITLPAVVTSAGAARAFVTDCLRDMRATAHADVAVLLVSELVTNAVLHAHSEIGLRVLFSSSGIRVEVSDTSTRSPVSRRFGLEAATGRGLLLVEALAADWGVAVADTGKTIWFEIAADEVAG